MTNDPEIRRFIQKEVQRQVNIVLFGSAGGGDTQTETINDLFPGMPGIVSRPVMHPFGFVSRAVKGTISVIARVGEHIGNRMVIGHRDANRPASLQEGESCVYSQGGYRVVWMNGQIMIGKGAVLEPAVMGTTLQSFLSQFSQLLEQHTHPSIGAPPTNAAAITQLRTAQVDSGKILSKDGGRF